MVTLGKVVDLTVDSCGGNTGTKKKKFVETMRQILKVFRTVPRTWCHSASHL